MLLFGPRPARTGVRERRASDTTSADGQSCVVAAGFARDYFRRYQARREVTSFWYPTWLAQPAALVPGAVEDTRRAIECYHRSLSIFRELDDLENLSLMSWNLGAVYEQRGDLVRAIDAVQESVDLKRKIGHPDAKEDAAILEKLRALHKQSG
jgi:tetratricopeptide (TPR) repeat protein